MAALVPDIHAEPPPPRPTDAGAQLAPTTSSRHGRAIGRNPFRSDKRPAPAPKKQCAESQSGNQASAGDWPRDGHGPKVGVIVQFAVAVEILCVKHPVYLRAVGHVASEASMATLPLGQAETAGILEVPDDMIGEIKAAGDEVVEIELLGESVTVPAPVTLMMMELAEAALLNARFAAVASVAAVTSNTATPWLFALTLKVKLLGSEELTVLLAVRPVRPVISAFSGAVKAFMEKLGLFCFSAPPPLKL